jgi:hypothetical protein
MSSIFLSSFSSINCFTPSKESSYYFFSSNETISKVLSGFKVIFGGASLLYLNSSEKSEAESETSSFIDYNFMDLFFCLAVSILWVSDAISETLKIARS